MTYEELKNKVIYHSHLYYDLSAPEISDADFDKLYDNLLDVERKQGWASYDSPTNHVGGLAGKIVHPFKLYSLKKVYNAEEVEPTFKVQTPKIDGANLSLIYNTKLKRALTRGDGEKGEDVTTLAKTIKNIPKIIESLYGEMVILGECVTDKNVENYRNYVSGALGLKSVEEFEQRNILFIAHDWLGVDLDYTTRMNFLRAYGFTTVLDDVAKSYPQDGLVFRVNSHEDEVKLGYTSKYPRFAVALKEREVETAITTLQEVQWSVGRTGTVNPTGVISPVVLEDATITRVTLHNMQMIEDNNLGIGDTIEIERAGGVIPKFLRVIEHAEHNLKVTKEHAEKAINAATYRDGPKLVLVDKNSEVNSRLLEHFINTIGIKGLGPANIKKMGLTHPEDLYIDQDWNQLGVVGAKIQQEIERSKSQAYETVLAAIGIPSVGKASAKLIALHIPKFKDLKNIEKTQIKGIGPTTIKAVLAWLEENNDWVTNLPVQLEAVDDVMRFIPTTRKICITGTLDIKRSELESILENRGFAISSSVTKDCYALIHSGDTSSSKYVKAKQQGIRLIDYFQNRTDVLLGNF